MTDEPRKYGYVTEMVDDLAPIDGITECFTGLVEYVTAQEGPDFDLKAGHLITMNYEPKSNFVVMKLTTV